MKKIVLSLILCSFTLLAISQKYAFVDTKYILDNIPEFKEAQKELDQLSEKWQKDAEQKKRDLDNKVRDYQAEQVLLSADMRKKREQEIQKLQEDLKTFQKEKFGVKGELYKKRKELIEPIQNKVYKAIKDLAKTSNYAFIFDKANQTNILYADSKYDKSKRILKDLGY